MANAPPTERLLDGPFGRRSDLTWRADIPAELNHPGDTNEAPNASRLRLCEDGRRLGPVHAAHAAIASKGRGRYSHWGDTLYFSTSDGSDPNRNGRRYTVSIVPPNIRLLGFGSCHVHAALADLQARDLADTIWPDARLSNSPRETLQLIKFYLGLLDIPQPLQQLTISGAEANELPSIVHTADAVFIELNTANDIRYREFWIRRNQLQLFLEPICALGKAEHAVARRWVINGLSRRDDATRAELSEQLLKLIPQAQIDRELAADIVKYARCDIQDSAGIACTLREICDLLRPQALCILSACHMYLPDGRPMSRWPENFLRIIELVCRDLGIPLLHSHRLVAEHGPQFALEKDLIHFTPQFLSMFADAILAMVRPASANMLAHVDLSSFRSR